MQRGSARYRWHRHCPRCFSSRRRAGQKTSRLRSGNAPLPPRRAPHRVGTSSQQHSAHAHHGQHGRPLSKNRKSRRHSSPEPTAFAANGDTANKIGTYQIAVLAKENNVPFYIAAPVSHLRSLHPQRRPHPHRRTLFRRSHPNQRHSASRPTFTPPTRPSMSPPTNTSPAIFTERGVAAAPPTPNPSVRSHPPPTPPPQNNLNVAYASACVRS